MAIPEGMGYNVSVDIQKRLAVGLGLLALFGAIVLAKLGASFFVPFLFALLIFLIFGPIMAKLKNSRVPYALAVVLVLVLFFVICTLLGYFLFGSLNTVSREIPKYYEKVSSIVRGTFEYIEDRFNLDLSNQLSELNWMSAVRPFLLGFSGGFIGFLRNLGIVILFLVFLFLEAPYFQGTIVKAFPESTSTRIIRIYKHSIRQISRYLGLKFLISAATGGSVWLSLALIGLDFAPLWGSLTFVLNFIPNIGSILGMCVIISMGFLQFYPSIAPILAIAISMSVIQLVLGNFLDPKLQGERLKLSPLLILVSLFFFSYLWGIGGMFLSVPMLSVVKIFCENTPELIPMAVIMENGRGGKKKRKSGRATSESESVTSDVKASVPKANDATESDGSGIA